MNNPGLIKTLTATAAIPSRRIVKFTAGNDAEVTQATATDALIGITSDLSVVPNESVDIVLTGVATVEYGGTITAGSLLTSDATGRAVIADAGDRIIGVAMQNGVVTDYGSVKISQS